MGLVLARAVPLARRTSHFAGQPTQFCVKVDDISQLIRSLGITSEDDTRVGNYVGVTVYRVPLGSRCQSRAERLSEREHRRDQEHYGRNNG